MKDYTFLFFLQCHHHDFGIIEKSRNRGTVAYSSGYNHSVSSAFNRSLGVFGEKLKARSENTAHSRQTDNSSVGVAAEYKINIQSGIFLHPVVAVAKQNAIPFAFSLIYALHKFVRSRHIHSGIGILHSAKSYAFSPALQQGVFIGKIADPMLFKKRLQFPDASKAPLMVAADIVYISYSGKLFKQRVYSIQIRILIRKVSRYHDDIGLCLPDFFYKAGIILAETPSMYIA